MISDLGTGVSAFPIFHSGNNIEGKIKMNQILCWTDRQTRAAAAEYTKEENLGHAIFLHPVSTIMKLLTTCSLDPVLAAALQCGPRLLRPPCIELRKYV